MHTSTSGGQVVDPQGHDGRHGDQHVDGHLEQRQPVPGGDASDGGADARGRRRRGARSSGTEARVNEVLVGPLCEGGDDHVMRHVQVLGELKRRREV